MLAFLFLRYLSDNYEQAAKKELGATTPTRTPSATAGGPPCLSGTGRTPMMCRPSRSRCGSRRITSSAPSTSGPASPTLALTQDGELLNTLQGRLQVHRERIVPEHIFGTVLGDQSRLRQARQDLRRPEREALHDHHQDSRGPRGVLHGQRPTLGDVYEYLIGQFAAGSGKKAGEFYTPQRISDILSEIVALDSQEPKTGKRKHLASVMDFACGSGSLLLNVRKRMGPHGIGKIYGQEKNITTYNLARMNMLLHGVKDSEFENLSR